MRCGAEIFLYKMAGRSFFVFFFFLLWTLVFFGTQFVLAKLDARSYSLYFIKVIFWGGRRERVEGKSFRNRMEVD